MKKEQQRLEFIRDVAAKFNSLLLMIDVLAPPAAKEEFLAFFRGVDQKLPYLTELSDAYSGEDQEDLTVTATYSKGVPPDVFKVYLNPEKLKHVQQGLTTVAQVGGRTTEIRLSDHDVHQQQAAQVRHAPDPLSDRVIDSTSQGPR